MSNYLFFLTIALLFSSSLISKETDSIPQYKKLHIEGNISFKKENYSLALEKYNKELSILDTSKKEQVKYYCLAMARKGVTYGQLGQNDLALEHLLNSLRKAEELKDTTIILENYNDIAITYGQNENYRKAIEYSAKSLNLASTIKDSLSMARSYTNLGLAYFYIEIQDTAYKYIKESLGLNKILNDSIGILYSTLNLAQVYSAQKKHHKSIEGLKEGIKLSRKLKNNYLLNATHTTIAKSYIDINEFDIAERHLLKAEKYFKKIKANLLLKDTYRNFSELYNKQKDYKNAYKYLTKLYDIEKTILNNKSNDQIAKLEIVYETEKKEKEIELLTKDIKIQELENAKVKYTMNLFVLLTVMVLLLSVVLFNQYRIKKKTNKLLEEKNEKLKTLNETKDKLLSVMTHDIRNPFVAFISIAQSLYNQHETLDKESIKVYANSINKFAVNINNLLENMLHWVQAQSGRIKVVKHTFPLVKGVNKVVSLYKINAEVKNLELVSRINKDIVISSDMNMLRVIIRNLVNNAIKFTPEGGKIEIDAKVESEKVIVCVKDTGIGIAPESLKDIFGKDSSIDNMGQLTDKGTGLGLKLCKEFAQMNGGDIWVESEKGKGTSFYFTLSTP